MRHRLKTNDHYPCPMTGIWSPQHRPDVRIIVLRDHPFPKGFGSNEWLLVRDFE
jgi:hypothetical protein